MNPETDSIYAKIKTISKEIDDLESLAETERNQYVFIKNRLNRLEALIDIKRRQLFSLKQGQLNLELDNASGS